MQQAQGQVRYDREQAQASLKAEEARLDALVEADRVLTDLEQLRERAVATKVSATLAGDPGHTDARTFFAATLTRARPSLHRRRATESTRAVASARKRWRWHAAPLCAWGRSRWQTAVQRSKARCRACPRRPLLLVLLLLLSFPAARPCCCPCSNAYLLLFLKDLNAASSSMDERPI